MRKDEKSGETSTWKGEDGKNDSVNDVANGGAKMTQAKLGPLACDVLSKGYLKRDELGRVVETPEEMFARVTNRVSLAESHFGKDRAKMTLAFGKIMRDGLIFPNSLTLMNAGLKAGQLSTCFVVPVDDSIAGIFDALKEMVIIHQSEGGTGFSFSKLRPWGAPIRSTGGVASGPVSFMETFDKATEVVKQGGRRRSANMAVLNADHPDIEEFVHAKEVAKRLENFNISVGATDQFMHKYSQEQIR